MIIYISQISILKNKKPNLNKKTLIGLLLRSINSKSWYMAYKIRNNFWVFNILLSGRKQNIRKNRKDNNKYSEGNNY